MNEPIETVLRVARIGAHAALAKFAGNGTIRKKADGSLVTAADLVAEDEMRTFIEQRFPEDGILGEELGVTRPSAHRRWLLDPVDGTEAFVRGIPTWATLVSLIEGDDVVAGCAVFPVLRDWIAARRGAGCWWNGTRCQVSNTASLRIASVLTTGDRVQRNSLRADRWKRLTSTVGAVRAWGDAYGYMLVAIGRVECMVDDELHVWDWAPFLPIIEEAGGVITDWSGGQEDLNGGVIATNARLAADVRGILADRPAARRR